MTTVEKLAAAIERLEDNRNHALDWFADPLFALLYGTIDAQLMFLRGVLEAHRIEVHWDTLVYTRYALALADAILGDPA